MAEFRGVMQQGHPRFETPRSAPVSTGIPACVLQGLGDGDFHFSDNPVTAEVCPDYETEYNELALFAISARN